MSQKLNLKHKYPNNINIINDTVMNTFLTRLCQPNCIQPDFNRYLEYIYKQLFDVAFNENWPTKSVVVPTRMTASHPQIKYKGEILKPNQKAVFVDIARAGMFPTQIGFMRLCELVNSEHLRVDHIFASRTTDSKGKVKGTNLSSSKIGGDIDKAIVFIADPMGASGSSISTVIKHYKRVVKGKPLMWICLNLIITPEFIKKMTTDHPEVIIYTARLDRGLSSEKVLKSIPGTFWNEEIGLDEKQYIVPGAGGVGELINNSFV